MLTYNLLQVQSSSLITFYGCFLNKEHESIKHETIQDNGRHGELRSDERLRPTKPYLQQKRIGREQTTQNEGFVNQDSVQKDISDVSVSIFQSLCMHNGTGGGGHRRG